LFKPTRNPSKEVLFLATHFIDEEAAAQRGAGALPGPHSSANPVFEPGSLAPAPTNSTSPQSAESCLFLIHTGMQIGGPGLAADQTQETEAQKGKT
jgi:hypothetical protein